MFNEGCSTMEIKIDGEIKMEFEMKMRIGMKVEIKKDVVLHHRPFLISLIHCRLDPSEIPIPRIRLRTSTRLRQSRVSSSAME